MNAQTIMMLLMVGACPSLTAMEKSLNTVLDELQQATVHAGITLNMSHESAHFIQERLEKLSDINQQDADGSTLLHYAAEKNLPRTIDILLQRGADPTISRNDGSTPEQLAQKCNHVSCVQVLQGTQANNDIQDGTSEEPPQPLLKKVCVGLLLTGIVYYAYTYSSRKNSQQKVSSYTHAEHTPQ